MLLAVFRANSASARAGARRRASSTPNDCFRLAAYSGILTQSPTVRSVISSDTGTHMRGGRRASPDWGRPCWRREFHCHLAAPRPPRHATAASALPNRCRQTTDQCAGFRQLYRGQADLGLPHQANLTTQRIGEQLVPKADAEIGPIEFAHPAPDRRFLRLEPGMGVFLPDIHRPAHHRQDVEAVECGDRLAFIQFDDVFAVPGRAPELSEHAAARPSDAGRQGFSCARDACSISLASENNRCAEA